MLVHIGMLTRLPMTIGDDCATGVASDGSASAEEGLDTMVKVSHFGCIWLLSALDINNKLNIALSR